MNSRAAALQANTGIRQGFANLVLRVSC